MSKISDLNLVGDLVSTDQLLALRSGANVRVTAGSLLPSSPEFTTLSVGTSHSDGTVTTYGNSDTIPALSIQSDANHGMHILHRATDGDFSFEREVGGTKSEFLRVARSSGDVTFNNSVGIGTASPSGELHVLSSANGDVYVERSSGAQLHLQAQSANGKIGTSSNHNLGLNTNGTTRVTIDTAGSVGINTSSSLSEKLNIADTADVGIKMTKTGSITTTMRAIGGALAFGVDGGAGTTERLRIGSSGQIGLSGANYGTSGQVLTSNGSGSAPTWQTVSGGGGGNIDGTTINPAAIQIGGTTAVDSSRNASFTSIASNITKPGAANNAFGGNSQYTMWVESTHRNDNTSFNDTMFLRNAYYNASAIGGQKAQLSFGVVDTDGDHHRAQITGSKDSGASSGRMDFWTRPNGGAVPHKALTLYQDRHAYFHATASVGGQFTVDSQQGVSVNNHYCHMGSTASGAMAIFGHNINTDSTTPNVVTSANTGYHSSMIKMYYDQGITFHTMDSTATAGDEFYNISGTTNERMRVDSSGNLLVGTTSTTPAFSSSVSGIALKSNESAISADNAFALVLNRNTGDGDIQQFRKAGTTVGSIGARGGDVYLETGNTGIRMYDQDRAIIPVGSSGISQNAAIDLGISNIRYKNLYLSGQIDINDNIVFNNSTAKRGIQGTSGDNDFWFVGGAATGSNSGYLEIATGDDGQTSGAAEPIYARQYGPGSPMTGTLVRTFKILDENGDTSIPGSFTAAGNITAYSDIRVKDNFEPVTDAVAKVNKLNGLTYTRTDTDDTETRYAGLIAQEVESVLPEAVVEADGHKSLDYNGTIALLVEAVKELSAKVAELEAKQ